MSEMQLAEVKAELAELKSNLVKLFSSKAFSFDVIIEWNRITASPVLESLRVSVQPDTRSAWEKQFPASAALLKAAKEK